VKKCGRVFSGCAEWGDVAKKNGEIRQRGKTTIICFVAVNGIVLYGRIDITLNEIF
jgi:hypothetical protein